MRTLLLLALAIVFGASPAGAAPAPASGIVRVRIVTSVGALVVGVDTRRAPATAANFLAYVDDQRFDGTTFYRSARNKADPRYGFVQAGIGTDARRILPPFPHERTDRTGVLHVDGAISMARKSEPNSAGGNFFITVGAAPYMDAAGQYQGYAAFGRVVSGMDTVRRILAAATGGGSGAMRGQMITRPVVIVSARRLDGVARPTGRPRPWLVEGRQRSR